MICLMYINISNLSLLTTNYRASLIIKTLSGWIKPQETILDIGCGNGLVSCRLVKAFSIKLYGCDVLKYLKVDIPFKHMTSTSKLPFKNKSFDAVLFNDVLHHMNRDNQAKILKEALGFSNKIIIIEDKPTITAKFFDIFLNKLHNPRMNIPLSYRTTDEWYHLFKQLGLKYRTRELHRSFWYPFSHIAFYLWADTIK